jgi:hypothetical protein
VSCCAAPQANATEGEDSAANNTATNSTKAPKMKKIKVPQQVRGSALSLPDLSQLHVTKAEHFGVLKMNDEEKKQSQALLDTFDSLDKEKKMFEMAKNALESYIINTRSILNEENVMRVRSQPANALIFVLSILLVTTAFCFW